MSSDIERERFGEWLMVTLFFVVLMMEWYLTFTSLRWRWITYFGYDRVIGGLEMPNKVVEWETCKTKQKMIIITQRYRIGVAYQKIIVVWLFQYTNWFMNFLKLSASIYDLMLLDVCHFHQLLLLLQWLVKLCTLHHYKNPDTRALILDLASMNLF